MTSAAASSVGDDPGDSDQKTIRTGLTASFLAAVANEIGDEGLTPVALARAACRVLLADGAGLSSMVSVLRMPLGSSSDVARQAEELQTTLGEGPCLHAAETQATVVAGPAELRSHWPLYADELISKTPYRAVVATPLRAASGGVFAALDLYSADPTFVDRLDPQALELIASPLAALLSVCVAQIPDIDAPEAGPDWFRAAAGHRHDVWVAIGMVMATRSVRTRDALSLLRGHAYAVGSTLDELATDIVDGRRSLPDPTT